MIILIEIFGLLLKFSRKAAKIRSLILVTAWKTNSTKLSSLLICD